MSFLTFLKKYPGLPAFILVLALFLGVNAAIFISDQREEIAETYHDHIQEELVLMGRMVQEAALRNDLGTVEVFLTEWGRSRDELVEIKARAVNGFTVVHYVREHPAQQTAIHRQPINYRGETLLTLEVAHDLDVLEESLEKVGWKLGSSSLVLTSLLALALWMVLRKTAVLPLEREVAKRLRTESALRESEDRFRALVESTSDWIWELDVEANFTYVSPRVKGILGYEPEEMVRKLTKFDLMPPDEAEKVRGEFKAFVAAAEPFENMINVNLHKDGREVIMESSGRPFFDAEGKVLGYRGIDRDVTARRQAELVAQWTHQVQIIISGLLQISIKPEPLTKQLRKALDLILRIQGPSFQAKGAIFLLDPKDGELVMTVQRGVEKPLQKACARVPVGHCLCGRAASSRWIVFADHVDERHETSFEEMEDHGHYCVPIGSGQEILGVLCLYLETGANRDKREQATLLTITSTLAGIIQRSRLDQDLQRAKEVAEEATRAKSAFLAAMSHDIRTPMNAILGMGEVLQESGLNPDQQNVLKVLTHAGENLLALINDILDLSKVEAGQLQMETVTFDLHELTEGTHHILHRKAQAQGTALTFEIQPACPRFVRGDPQRLRQILLNLLGNGLKFTEKGSVALTVEPLDEERIQFTVRDTGIGIPETSLAGIFDPFRQAEDSTSRRFGGTGLGLSICSRLVKAMDGEIHVESRVDQGSVFRFHVRLPRTEETGMEDKAAHTVRQRERAPRPLEGGGLNILLADDAEDNRLVISAYLKKTPHRVTGVINGEEAVKAFMSGRFDLVLMDIQMPIMNGLEATEKIRAWETEQESQPTPIIALTANAMREDIEKTTAAGCDLHLSKPIRKARLLDIIRGFHPHADPESAPIDDLRSDIEPEASDPGDLDVLKSETLSKLRLDLGGNIDRFLMKFQNNLPTRIQAISDAVKREDSKALANESHRLKGGARTIGAERVAALCHRLEKWGEKGVLTDAVPLISRLEEAGAEVEEALAKALEKALECE